MQTKSRVSTPIPFSDSLPVPARSLRLRASLGLIQEQASCRGRPLLPKMWPAQAAWAADYATNLRNDSVAHVGGLGHDRNIHMHERQLLTWFCKRLRHLPGGVCIHLIFRRLRSGEIWWRKLNRSTKAWEIEADWRDGTTNDQRSRTRNWRD